MIYPRALAALAERYRLRGIGGTSAGAMAAAVAAAAEYGRTTGGGGFDLFDDIPTELGGGGLLRLFQPERETRPLFRLLLALTGGDRPEGRTVPSKIIGTLAAALSGYPLVATLAALPGLAVILLGALVAGPWAVLLGAVLLVIIELIALPVAILRNLSRDVPANNFGICTGLSTGTGEPAVTEWLQSKINIAAGLTADDPPLTFGQLWTAGHRAPAGGPDDAVRAALQDPTRRAIDLRVITTCLSESRPYELPFESTRFFYDADEWRRIFPASVLAALQAAPASRTPQDRDPVAWQSEHDQALQHSPGLRRLPDAEHLPIVVAVRMSLSMPMMISAVPLWAVERTDLGGNPRLDPTGPRHFEHVWFSDGGLSSNFPVQLFDAALPTRPTYAINLQSFPPGVQPAIDETDDARDAVEWAQDNADGLAPKIARWPSRGLAAILGFFGAIYTSSSSWQDNTQLNFPGFRDRIVRVLQTAREGGINLAMSDATIERLAGRGEYAAQAIMDQFDQPHYPPLVDGRPTRTGWDNHRWVRYRALLSVLPAWAESYRLGRAVLGDDLVADPPSYRFTDADEARLAAELDRTMARLAQLVDQADPQTVAALAAQPRPVGAIRRVPQI
ncbi:patatin-like phospholipase family protein [Microlunatus soli]|uniref:Patatin-like phospholipase n=1 Tax=Microlunatus soli TaxID=630515 RepID=A0A1H1R2W1_9ACTN|nr:Patatin-like phospholipase [Microlunatus soli]